MQEADREPGGLALLAAALQDIGLAAGDDRTLQLACYREVVGGLAGVLSARAERGLALLGDEGPAALPRVFAHLVHIDPETGAATRRRAPLAQWPADSAERRLIDCFARDADRPRDAVRLLVCDRGRGGEPTVEVAHEALLREWPRLTAWIRTQREALIRRDEVLRDAARWDARGRPDTLLPHPDVVAEVRAKFAEAGLWDELRGDDRVAYFLARDDFTDLRDLTLGAFERCGGTDAAAALPQVLWLTAAGRTWETRAAFGRWAVAQAPALAAWLRTGLLKCSACWRRTTPCRGISAGPASATCWPPWVTTGRGCYANVDECYDQTGPYKLDQTTAVGLYPQGVSPAGLLDCAGNVWEWCLNKFDNPPDTNKEGEAGRALRGGSWSCYPALARVVSRSGSFPTDRNDTVGFRVVCACAIPLITDPLVTEH